MEQLAGEPCGGVVREMPVARGDALLDCPGVGSRTEQLLVVIGFEDQEVGAGQRQANLGGRPPQVRGYRDPGLRRRVHQCHRHRIRRIVHRQERFDTDGSDLEGPSHTVGDGRLRPAEDL